LGLPAELPHDELQEEQCGFACLFVGRKLFWIPRSSSPPNGAIGEDDVHAVFVSKLGQLHVQAVAAEMRG